MLFLLIYKTNASYSKERDYCKSLLCSTVVAVIMLAETLLCFFFQEVVDGLKSIGHETEVFGVGGSVVVGIARQNGKLYANSDFRKAGEVDGI